MSNVRQLIAAMQQCNIDETQKLLASIDEEQLKTKFKRLTKVIIKTSGFYPLQVASSMLEVLLQDPRFKTLLLTNADAIKAFIKQTTSALEDAKNGQVGQAKLRGIMRIIANLNPKERDTLLQQANAFYNKTVKKEQEKGADINSGKLKKIKIAIDKITQLCNQDPAILEASKAKDYFEHLVTTVLEGEAINTLLLINDRQFADLAGWQINQLLHLLIGNGDNKVLAETLARIQKINNVEAIAGDEFRNRVLCLAILSGKADAVKLLMNCDCVTKRMQQTGKDVMKALIQGVAAMRSQDVTTDKIMDTMCANPAFVAVLAQDKAIKVMVNEMLKPGPRVAAVLDILKNVEDLNPNAKPQVISVLDKIEKTLTEKTQEESKASKTEAAEDDDERKYSDALAEFNALRKTVFSPASASSASMRKGGKA